MEKLKEDCIITDERLEYMKAIAELYVPNLEAEIYKNICTTTALPIFIKRYNQNKLKEMQAIFKHFDIQIINPPSDFDPIEDGETFFDNSLIKAKAASKLMGLPALADDSGLQDLHDW